MMHNGGSINQIWHTHAQIYAHFSCCYIVLVNWKEETKAGERGLQDGSHEWNEWVG
jgi:hypothetical protein